MEDYQIRNQQRRQRRRRRQQQRRMSALTLLAVILLAGGFWAHHALQKDYYTAQQLGISTVESPCDADGDGMEDYADMVQGALSYIQTDPHYESRYYEGGYPDDGCGVCTDVIWQAFRAAGYELKDLVDEDIARRPEAYTQIEDADPNIDFRRVENLDVFFAEYAQVLTCSFDDPSQWQAGDIVTFDHSEHIALCSDKRNKNGIPWIIHHSNPIEEAVEANQMGRMSVTGHYRWIG